ncbi:helix-turn-helix transcriptional regulator [Arthrobacter psychrolactophilus]
MAGIAGAAGVGVGIVGRAKELAALKSFLDAAVAGTAGTLVVSGDAGVGKTALVQHACLAAGSTPWIFAGAALPLSTMTVPFLALRTAFRNAPRIPGVTHPTSTFFGHAYPDVPVIINDWLNELCLNRPVVLVIDDLHWADLSTLDVLMYLIAGPAGRRLALIATLRSGEPGEGNRLRSWLADIRRLPRVDWMALGPLDRIDTGAQLANLKGVPPHQSLVEEVFTHTAGNAYLNRLVTASVSPDARQLPRQLPADLKSAVLRSWLTLSPEAQQLTQVMAVGGSPISAQRLSTLLPAVYPNMKQATEPLPLLHECQVAGILDGDPDATLWWFHHPMIAEALVQDLDGDDRSRWHSAFARDYEERMEAAPTADFQQLAAIADHHHAAGHAEDAFHWALRASSAAGKVGGSAEMLRLLRRALKLHRSVPDAHESLEELWSQLRAAAEETGSMEDELEAIEALLVGLDGASRPLDESELLVRRMILRFSTGKAFLNVNDAGQAVKLAAVEPASWQHALALAELAHAGLWHDDPVAAACSRQALTVAAATGNPRALSYALTVNAMAAVFEDRAAEGIVFARRGLAAAVHARDFWAFVHATMWLANATDCWASLAFAELMRAGRQQLDDLGAPHTYLAKLAANEAGSFLAVGRWRECALALRLALGTDPGVMADVDTRLVAARLAAWQGRQAEAEAHLGRAEELFAISEAFLNLSFDAVRAEVHLAAGNPEAAYAAAWHGACTEGAPPTMCEWLVPWAARSLADLIRLAQDAGNPTVDLQARLQDLVARFPEVFSDGGFNSPLYKEQVAAFNALYAAEVGRAKAEPNNAGAWTATADAFHEVSFLWEESYSCWRAAESLLLHGHSHQARAATMLRRGLQLAEELQALPLQSQLQELAARARINTSDPEAAAKNGFAELPGLTPREREILGYVVAGRSYDDIARALVISEKTVSTHISNMLRKTGAANRLDLARMTNNRANVRGDVVSGG